MSDAIIANLVSAGRLTVNFATGNVFAPRSNTPHKPLGAETAKGYLRTCVRYDGRQVSVMLHRVVWIAANGVLRNGQQIDHFNGRKADNRLSNLEAVSNAENMRRAAMNGLTNGGWRNAPRDQKGRFLGKKAAGRLLDGRLHDDLPGETSTRD